MPQYTQISVALRNEPGALCRLCGILARADVNIMGLDIDDCTDEGFVRLIVDDPKKAQKILDQAKVPNSAQDVLMLDMANEPGMLQRTAAKLAEARVNIHYAYGTVDLHGRGGALVLRVSDLAKAIEAVEKEPLP
jgi:hypothetical protein